MKILQIIQKNMAVMGFVPNQQQKNNKKSSEKLKQTAGIYVSVLNTSLIGVYFFHVANSREEYMYSIFALICAVGFFLSHISVIFNNDKIFNTIDMGENVIFESEFQFSF